MKPHKNVGTIGQRSPTLMAAMLGAAMADVAAVAGPEEIAKTILSGHAWVTSAKPHDEDRLRKAEERRARRQAKRPNARIFTAN